MKNKRHVLFVIVFLFCAIITPAQTVPAWSCGTNDMLQLNLVDDPSIVGSFSKYENSLAYKQTPVPTQAPTYLIPVVFHVISTVGSPAISYSQIQWQLAALNAAFANNLPAFNGMPVGPQGKDTQIQFCFAKAVKTGPSTYGPWPNLTPGMINYNTSNGFAINVDITNSFGLTQLGSITNYGTNFPKTEYLNIWVVPNICQTTGPSCNISNPPTVIGFGFFPWLTMALDGVIMRKDCIGNNSFPTAFPMLTQLDKGLILAHEVGHYLGLFHTFESVIGANLTTAGNPIPNCYGATGGTANNDGDMIYDTPPTLINSQLTPPQNTCNESYAPYGAAANENDQLENFMTYSDDDYMNTFTIKQHERMWGALNTAWGPGTRTVLVSPQNLVNTGVNTAPSCGPGILTAVFNWSIASSPSCNNATIQFFNPQTPNFSATTYTWNFGDSFTGTGPNPIHTYTLPPNSFTVTCTASSGTTTTTFTQVISPPSGAVTIVGQSSAGIKVCRGSEQSILLRFPPGIASAVLTDGTNTYNVQNDYITATGSVNIMPFTLPLTSAASVVSFSMSPSVCGTLNLGVATFSLQDCCTNLVTNGDLESGLTGFYSDFFLTTGATGSGNVAVNLPNLSLWPSGTFVPSGQSIIGDGCSNSPLNPNGTNFVGTNCIALGTRKIIFGQGVSGLKPSTTYYVGLKSTEGHDAGYVSGGCGDLTFALRVFDGTGNLISTGNFTPVIQPGLFGGALPIVTGGTKVHQWQVFGFNFTTGPTVSPTYSFEVYQTDKFGLNGFDFLMDNLSINELSGQILVTPTLSSICPNQTVQINATGNCVNLSNYVLTWNPVSSLSCGSCANPIASPSVTTVYTLIAVPPISTPPQPNIITTVTVNVATPTINITPSPLGFCLGQTATLTATGANTYTWLPTGPNTATTVVTPTTITIYTVTGTNTLGCVGSKTISSFPGGPVNIVPSGTLICTGQTATLTATNANTYTWSPGSIVSPSISININGPTSYTVAATNSLGCVSNTVTTINPVATPTISVNSATICPSNSATLTASGASTFTWQPVSLVGTSIVVTPTATTIYTLTATNGGCISSTTTQVFVSPPANYSINVNPSGGICVPGQSITLTGSGVGTYTWTDGTNTYTGNPLVITPSASTNFTVNFVNSFGCPAPPHAISVVVSTICACSAATGTLPTTLANTTVSAGSYAINQNLSITSGTVQFNNAEFKIAPGVTITVNPGAFLFIYNAHLYTCFDMWQGIVIQNGGRIKIGQGALIEDAVTGIDISNSTLTTPFIAEVAGAVFNRNLDAISINNYAFTLPSYPFWFSDNVFTSRQFTFTPTSWPVAGSLKAACTLTSSLASPYCLQGFPYANLKTPNSGISSRIGISLNAVGVLSNPTNTTLVTYNEIVIGDSLDKKNENVFDNLGVGINATASSLRVTGNVFQNGRVVSGFQASGIRSISGSFEQTHFRAYALINSLGKLIRNEFYDLYFGIQISNTFITDIYGQQFYSTQQQSGYNPLTFYSGKYAVFMVTNRFMAYNISDNKILNYTNPISLTGNYTNLTLGAFSGVAQYVGRINIDRNNIKATNAGIITTEYVSNAISLQQPLLPPPGATTFSTDTRLSITDNNIKDVYRGVFLQNWHNGQHPNVVTNTITLEGDLITGSVRQYGVSGVQCTSLSIYSNSVKGNASLTNTISTGIYTSVNNNLSVTCNTVRAVYQGFEFAGSQPVNTNWKGNLMRNNARGFVLSNNGIIGTQGSAGNPIDNQWVPAAAWSGPGNLHTYTSASDASFSKLYTRSGGVYNPTNNGGLPNFNSYIFNPPILTPPTNPYICSPPPSIIAPGGGGTLDQIAQDSVPFVTVVTESRFIHKNHLYRRLKHQPSLMSSDVVLQNFYTSSMSTSREALSNIESNLGSGNTALASSQLSSFTPTNNIESNYKQFFQIYNAYYNNTYNAADSLNLVIMANKCPFIEGSVVYQARAMFNMIYSAVELFNDNCPVEENIDSRMMIPQTIAESNSLNNWSVELYPNPATNDVFITGSKDVEDIQVFISDVSGKIVANYLVKTQAFTGKIALDLKNGIYFVTLVNQSNERVVKKLVISK